MARAGGGAVERSASALWCCHLHDRCSSARGGNQTWKNRRRGSGALGSESGGALREARHNMLRVQIVLWQCLKPTLARWCCVNAELYHLTRTAEKHSSGSSRVSLPLLALQLPRQSVTSVTLAAGYRADS